MSLTDGPSKKCPLNKRKKRETNEMRSMIFIDIFYNQNPNGKYINKCSHSIF
jgi:hypothetical protein